MSNKTSEAQVADIIRDAQMPVTQSTLEWFEALYKGGAVIYDPDGGVRLNPKVREAMAAMHQILAGGDVEFVVKRKGDATFERLEAQFDRALEETNAANKLRDPDDGNILPYIP